MPVTLSTGAVNAGPLLVFLKVIGAGTGSIALVLRGIYIVPYRVDLTVTAVFPVQGVLIIVTVAIWMSR